MCTTDHERVVAKENACLPVCGEGETRDETTGECMTVDDCSNPCPALTKILEEKLKLFSQMDFNSDGSNEMGWWDWLTLVLLAFIIFLLLGGKEKVTELLGRDPDPTKGNPEVGRQVSELNGNVDDGMPRSSTSAALEAETQVMEPKTQVREAKTEVREDRPRRTFGEKEPPSGKA